MCGENLTSFKCFPCKIGSPPRVRGKPPIFTIACVYIGITPACAGKTYVIRVKLVCVQDHPRVCGENSASGSMPCRMMGSPPRVRGKPPHFIRCRCNRRITPACAGKTLHFHEQKRAEKDHPRVCGENGRYRGALESLEGSPPRVRGKPEIHPGQKSCCRITPACAGKTRDEAAEMGTPEDHPRVCGEN